MSKQRNSRAGAMPVALIMTSKYHEIDFPVIISEKALEHSCGFNDESAGEMKGLL
jgi:hypothetical protein